MMRLAVAIALVAALGSTEIERAQQTARGRDAERAQFHRKYLFDLPGDTVTQIEVITEFRRLVIITEEHLRNGDQMFSRGLRAAEAAIAPTRGILTLKAQLRFHPLNTYADIPAYLYHFDACTIPFLINQVTKATDPVKLYEYFSLGKPVVATKMESYIVIAGCAESGLH